MNVPSRCIPFTDVKGSGAGGKAEGLASLAALGLPVPDGFVILNPTPNALPDDLEAAYDRLGRGRVAVRSSASDEDGTAVSFAGQHATVLDVEGMPALRDAVVHCINSLASERAQAYRQARVDNPNGTMSVIVQRMVDARSAGAIFTADPTTARRDRMVAEAVKGTGDALMEGSVTADHFTLARDGSIVKREFPGSEPCIHDDELRALASDALHIEQHVGMPVDCEWAIDHAGAIAWLQARPITTLPADPRELDDELNPDDLYVRCSVEELIPGIITPLSASTTLRALDLGLQRMYRRIATLETFSEQRWLFVQQFGYPFLNASAIAGIGRTTISGDEEDAIEMMCGEPVSGIIPGPRAPLSERLRNGLRFFNSLLLVNHAKKLQQLIDSIDLAPGGDARETYANIDRELPKLAEVHYRHNSSSMLAAFAIGVLPRLISRGAQPTEQHNAEAARLLSGAKDAENYDIVSGVKRIVSALIGHDAPQLDRFVGLDAQTADHFLRHEASASVQRAYTTHLERHGHRCIRELDMYATEWAEDPTPVVKAVQSGVQAARAGGATVQKDKQIAVPLTLAPVVRLGWRGIRNRETTKSKAVLATALYRRAYRTLARQMADEGLLPDEDLVFFLQHAELAELLSNRDQRLIERASARREVLPYQEKFVFKRHYHGAIGPIDPQRPSEEGILRGKPVSIGVARGRARVVQTLEAAGDVQPGEILIAPVVEVGWTPTFATIAGFASEVGSSVSHGAVVAREFGIPLVVNLRDATRVFGTGDLVELDANQGVLRRIPED